MVSHNLRTLCIWLTMGALSAAAISAQKPTPPPVDPDLPVKLKELKSLVKDRKMTRDFQAIGLIQKLTEAPDKLNPKDRKKLCKALGSVFKTGKVRPAGKDHLYHEAGDALSKFETDGSKELLKTVENKRIKDNIRLRAHLIEGLGRTKDLKMVDWIVDEATRSHHDEIRAAAGKALGEFTNLKTKGRRKVVKELIRSWGSLHSSATTAVNLDRNAPIDFGPETARRTLRVIEAKWVRTLSKLTGQSMSKFSDWQRWQNKNRQWVAPGMKK